jgi:hypothetical protein
VSGDWLPGDAVRFRGAGAQAPAIDVSLAIPPPLPPTEAPASGDVVNPAQDLPITWTPGTTAFVSAALLASKPASGDTIEVWCRFEAAGGEGSVPAAVLSELAPSGGASLILFSEDYTFALVQNWLVKASVRTSPVLRPITFQ